MDKLKITFWDSYLFKDVRGLYVPSATNRTKDVPSQVDLETGQKLDNLA